jgi:hypothetical protein
MSVAPREVYDKREGKYLMTIYRSVGILHHVNTIIYLKFKLQLKFRDNRIYSSVIVNFHVCVGKNNTLIEKYKLVRINIMKKNCFL